MNKNVMLLALAAAGFFMYQKKAKAAGTRPVGSAQLPAVNVQSDMWARLLGSEWRNLVGAQTASGSQAFTMKNLFGQVVTSDGTPVYDGQDAVDNWQQQTLGLPSYNDTLGMDTMAALGNPDLTDPATFGNTSQFSWWGE